MEFLSLSRRRSSRGTFLAAKSDEKRLFSQAKLDSVPHKPLLPCPYFIASRRYSFSTLLTVEIEDITWPRGDTKFLFECWIISQVSVANKWSIFQREKRNFVSPSGHKHPTFFTLLVFAVKGAIYYMLFLHVKISCFRAKLTWYFIGVYSIKCCISQCTRNIKWQQVGF